MTTDPLTRTVDRLQAEVERLTGENRYLRNQLDAALGDLERLATTDPDTGLANRRRFHDILEHEWNRAVRTEEPVSLLVIDIDEMNRYNEACGRRRGDECIRAIAECLHSRLKRACEFVARTDGEQFAVVMAPTSPEEAARHAESLRRHIEELRLPHPNSATHDVVTVSVGVAGTVPSADRSPTQLISAAVDALDHAKRSGRNRVVHLPVE